MQTTLIIASICVALFVGYTIWQRSTRGKLIEQNRAMREQLGASGVTLSEAQRERLSKKAEKLDPELLKKISSID